MDEETPDDLRTVILRWGMLGVFALAIALFLITVPRGSSGRDPERAAADTTALWRKLQATTSPCDLANLTVVAALSGPRDTEGLVNAYSAASSGSQVCSNVWVQVLGLKAPPSLPEDARDKFNATLEACANAYLRKSAMLKEMAEVIGGNGSIARIALVQALGNKASAETAQCADDFKAIAKSEGLAL